MGFIFRKSFSQPEPPPDVVDPDTGLPLVDYGPDDYQIPDMSNAPLTLGQKNFIETVSPRVFNREMSPSATLEGVDLSGDFVMAFGMKVGGSVRVQSVTGQWFNVEIGKGEYGLTWSTYSGSSSGTVRVTLGAGVESVDGWVVIVVARAGANTRISTAGSTPQTASSGGVFDYTGATVTFSNAGHLTATAATAERQSAMPAFYDHRGMMQEMASKNSYWDVLSPQRVAILGDVWRKPLNAQSIRVWTVDDAGNVRQVTKPLPSRTSISFPSGGQALFGGEQGQLPSDGNRVRSGASELSLFRVYWVETRTVYANKSGVLTEIRESEGGENRPGFRIGRFTPTGEPRETIRGPEAIAGVRGTIKKWHAKVGDSVNAGSRLVTVEYVIDDPNHGQGTRREERTIGKSVIFRYIF